MPDVPIVLVGNKVDLRSDAKTLAQLEQRGESIVSFSEGERMARDVRAAAAYLETSALTGDGVTQVFDTLIDVALNMPIRHARRTQKACVLL